MTLLLIVAFSLLGGVVSVLLAGTVLAVDRDRLGRILPHLVAFSTGTLLGAALLGLLPHAARSLPLTTLFRTLLVGLLAFFILEKLLIWRHCHAREGCEFHASSGPLLLVGDSFHNFVDGIVIAGAFLESTPLGIAAGISTIAHEIPQELGEFAVYLRGGYTRRKALLLNGLSGLASLPGAILGFLFFSRMKDAGPYLLAFAAAGFVYVALADLVPAQRGRSGLRASLVDTLILAAGIGIMALLAHRH